MPEHSRNFQRSDPPTTESDRSEWDFSGCPPSELNFCYLYEYAREAANQGSVIATGVEELRRQAKGRSFKQLAELAATIQGALGWRLLVAFREWPKKPYLRIPSRERQRRLMILFPGYFPELASASARDILLARIPDRLEDAFRATLQNRGLASMPVGSAEWSRAEVEWIIANGRVPDWSEALLKSGERPQRYIIALNIDLTRSDPSLVASFENLLKLIRPKDVRQIAESSGKLSSASQSRVLLGYLSVYRLSQSMPLAKIRRLAHQLGWPQIQSLSKLSAARKKAGTKISEFAQLKQAELG